MQFLFWLDLPKALKPSLLHSKPTRLSQKQTTYPEIKKITFAQHI
ncbi:hypothetical protein M145_2725 [Bacteroides fragilis str. 34-F-2 |nr:hypothetical protein M145_2725 [Bacteroides fragilis str. 34-F-2 \